MNKTTIIVILTLNAAFLVYCAAPVQGTAGVLTAVGSSVTACQAGYSYVADTNDSCLACIAGQTANLATAIDGFTDEANPKNVVCADCPANYKCSASTATGTTTPNAPVACEAGTGSAAGQSACISCGTGVATCTVTVTGGVQTVSAPLTCSDGYTRKTTGSPPVVTCVTPTVAGCKTATNDGTFEICTACGVPLSGYKPKYPTGNPAVCAKCTSQSGGCGTCTDAVTEVCYACNPTGFYKTADATLTCQPCAMGCLTCPDGADGATKCSTVAKGYKLSAAAPAAPTACGEDGKTSDSGTSMACDVSCTDANCNTCNKDQAKCEVCKDNFELQSTDSTCQAILAANIYLTCKTANQADSADNCTSCDVKNNREIEMDTAVTPNVAKKFGKCLCKAGFFDASVGSVIKAVCQACGTGVKTCDLTQALTCTDAANVVAGVNCVAKAQTDIDRFFYNVADSAYKPCAATCLTCNGTTSSNCVKCPEQPTNFVEPTSSSASNYLTYIKGPRVNIGGQCYGECPSNYVRNSDKTNCIANTAASSYSNGISNIFYLVAAIVILMF